MKTPLATLRDRKAKTADFRAAALAVARTLAGKAHSSIRKGRDTDVSRNMVLVPILRSGLALLPAFLETFPNAKVGFLGFKRNEKTLKPKKYYQNLPTIGKTDQVIVLDPMLATGGSAVAGIRALVEAGTPEKNIMFVGVVSAPEGLLKLQKNFPQVTTIVAFHDEKLDKNGYIVPGLGDFGDRYFG